MIIGLDMKDNLTMTVERVCKFIKRLRNFHEDFIHGEGIYFKMDNTAIRGIWNYNKLLKIF
jgi:hypothetical protein